MAAATPTGVLRLLDRFDQVFNKVFKGLLTDYGQRPVDVPEDWLKAVAEKFLTQEEMDAIKSLGSWDEIMETLKKRLEEQEKRHQGGNKWIGTGGTSASARPRPGSPGAATIGTSAARSSWITAA